MTRNRVNAPAVTPARSDRTTCLGGAAVMDESTETAADAWANLAAAAARLGVALAAFENARDVYTGRAT